jgi:NADPH-dependent ferric siderophore reductase
VADDFFDIVSEISEGAGLAGAPARGIRAFLRRDEARNLMRSVQREIEARWAEHEFRSDVYEQVARHLQNPVFAGPFEAAAHGDADALEAVRVFLANHLGTESRREVKKSHR